MPVILLLLVGCAIAGVARCQVAEAGEPSELVDNPFANFETHRLANGVKLWFKQLPAAPNVAVSVGVPFGSDLDPEGKEELAHFTEHMLFADHDGRTEDEILEEIASRGGRRNGRTGSDRTWYG